MTRMTKVLPDGESVEFSLAVRFRIPGFVVLFPLDCGVFLEGLLNFTGQLKLSLLVKCVIYVNTSSVLASKSTKYQVFIQISNLF